MARWLCFPPCSIRQYCCDILSDHCDLPVSHTCGDRSGREAHRNLMFMFMVCLCFYIYSNSNKIADNWTFGNGSYCLSLYMVAPVFCGCFLLYNVMWMCPTAKQRGALSGKKNPNKSSFFLRQRVFLKRCLHLCVINHAHECQNGLMMGSLCGGSLWEL